MHMIDVLDTFHLVRNLLSGELSKIADQIMNLPCWTLGMGSLIGFLHHMKNSLHH